MNHGYTLVSHTSRCFLEGSPNTKVREMSDW
jgi:hypothetical protein